jgi:hypothetical protein
MMGAEIAELLFASPPYDADNVCCPTDKLDRVINAFPFERGVVPIAVPPSMRVTEPVATMLDELTT